MTVPSADRRSLPRVSIVIPALNEALNLPYVFARIPEDIHEIILVDGYSEDDTVLVARRLSPDVRVIKQTRKGKGNALACGLAAATGDIIAMIDADGSADPREIPSFVDALLDGADFAKGTRYAKGGGSNDITRLRSLGNRLLTSLFNLCYRVRYRDLCYGYNVFWRHHTPVLGLDATAVSPGDGNEQRWGDGFEVETLIHIRVAKAGLLSPRCRASSMHAYMASATSTRSAMAFACSARSSPNGGKPGAPPRSRPPSRPPRPPPRLGATPWLRFCRRMPPRPFCRRRRKSSPGRRPLPRSGMSPVSVLRSPGMIV